MEFDADSYSDEELEAEFDALFPQGFSGSDVLQELAPGGWERSPLLALCHPSLAQVFEESLRIHRNLCSLHRPDDTRPLPPEPTLDEVARDFRDRPVEAEREVRELVGQCLWEIFSDSHEVVGPDGRVLDLGSFRASGGFLAEYLNRRSGVEQYDYLDFYMGTAWVAQRADLTPVYRMIFGRLRGRGLDWVYHFPRLYAVNLRPLEEAMDRKDEPDWLNYSPSEALAREEEEEERDRNLAELRESLDEGYRAAIEEALKLPAGDRAGVRGGLRPVPAGLAALGRTDAPGRRGRRHGGSPGRPGPPTPGICPASEGLLRRPGGLPCAEPRSLYRSGAIAFPLPPRPDPPARRPAVGWVRSVSSRPAAASATRVAVGRRTASRETPSGGAVGPGRPAVGAGPRNLTRLRLRPTRCKRGGSGRA